MARIAGVNLPEKRIEIALTYIYGIGKSQALKILKKAKIDPNVRTSKLNEEELERIREIVEKQYKVEGELKVEISTNIKRLKDIGTWKGLRHIKNLPVRGQKTKSNARTKRGKRITVATAKRVIAEKT